MPANPMIEFRIPPMLCKRIKAYCFFEKQTRSTLVLASVGHYAQEVSKGAVLSFGELGPGRKDMLRVSIPRRALQSIDLIATRERHRYFLEGKAPLVHWREMGLEWALAHLIGYYLDALGWTEEASAPKIQEYLAEWERRRVTLELMTKGMRND